jgi:SAM-dependent methyltransferase
MVRLGELVQRLALTVMRPDDLVEFSRRYYRHPTIVETWCDPGLIDEGLTESEKTLLQGITGQGRRLLVLGVGGGREAIALAQMGFQVTGVDFVTQMVPRALSNAQRAGVQISVLAQDFSDFPFAPECYDVVWLSAGMYSSIPTRKRRVRLLASIRKGLTPGGYFLCQFLFYPNAGRPSKLEYLEKIWAHLTFGYVENEQGDCLLGNSQFMHLFYRESDLKSEFEEAGFEILSISGTPADAMRGAVLSKH